MKNERFERYIYTGVTAILVLIAAVFVVFLFLERSAVFAFLGKVRFVLAPVIYGAVLAFLMSPVYNWCYRLTVYTGKSGEPKARFKMKNWVLFSEEAWEQLSALYFFWR